MERRKIDRGLIFAILLTAFTFLWVTVECKADIVFTAGAKTRFETDISMTATEPFGWKPCDFGGCPVPTTVQTTIAETTTEEPEPAPVQYEYDEPELIFEDYEEAEYSGGQSLGIFKCTAYCGCYECSEEFGNMTAKGTVCRPNYTIAVDPTVIPYWTKVRINGIVYSAEDCGSLVKGNSIDIYFDNHGECENWGIRYLEVFLA